jgi:hypothetical protein
MGRGRFMSERYNEPPARAAVASPAQSFARRSAKLTYRLVKPTDSESEPPPATSAKVSRRRGPRPPLPHSFARRPPRPLGHLPTSTRASEPAAPRASEERVAGAGRGRLELAHNHVGSVWSTMSESASEASRRRGPRPPRQSFPDQSEATSPARASRRRGPRPPPPRSDVGSLRSRASKPVSSRRRANCRRGPRPPRPPGHSRTRTPASESAMAKASRRLGPKLGSFAPTRPATWAKTFAAG